MDRELQPALDVDPSPEFLARVRQQIARESSQTRVWRAWWVPAVTAGALVVAVVAAIMPRSFAPPNVRVEPLTASVLGQAAVPMPASPTATPHVFERERYADVHAGAPDLPLRAEGLVLVDAREKRALEKLLRTGPLRPEEAVVAASLDQIEIVPIVITPLEASGEGVRQ